MSAALKTYWKSSLIRQSAGTAGLFFLGDVIAQKLMEEKSSFDWARNARLVFFGGFMAGPSMTIWYRYLDRLKLANKIVPPTVIKVGLDQSLFAPFFLATFFVTQGIMSRKGWDDLKQDFSQKYWNTLKLNYLIWPAVQLVNFYWVPLPYRVMLVNTVALGWNTYLSLMNSSKK